LTALYSTIIRSDMGLILLFLSFNIAKHNLGIIYFCICAYIIIFPFLIRTMQFTMLPTYIIEMRTCGAWQRKKVAPAKIKNKIIFFDRKMK
jgi:hypothetical protein